MSGLTAYSGPRIRCPAQGPELELIEGALEAGIWKTAADPVLFREPALPTGFPDLVAAFTDPTRDVQPNPARLNLSTRDIRLLHHVYWARTATRQQISAALRLPEARLLPSLERLSAAGVVKFRGDAVIAQSLRYTFAAARIVAIEAKISDWANGIKQSIHNTWFASHSYLLLPASRFVQSVRSAATCHGIGIITYDGDRCVVRVAARQQRIPASYGSWLVNEWVVRAEAHES